jgi:hypothetical protein
VTDQQESTHARLALFVETDSADDAAGARIDDDRSRPR